MPRSPDGFTGTRWVALAVFLLLLAGLAAGTAPPPDKAAGKAKHVTGTVKTLPEEARGTVELTTESFIFATKENGRLSIPYAKIVSMEFGPTCGGRQVSIGIGLAPVLKLPVKRTYYLNLSFRDEKERWQGVVLELSRGSIYEILSTLEEKTGQRVQFESVEARDYAERH